MKEYRNIEQLFSLLRIATEKQRRSYIIRMYERVELLLSKHIRALVSEVVIETMYSEADLERLSKNNLWMLEGLGLFGRIASCFHAICLDWAGDYEDGVDNWLNYLRFSDLVLSFVECTKLELEVGDVRKREINKQFKILKKIIKNDIEEPEELNEKDRWNGWLDSFRFALEQMGKKS